MAELLHADAVLRIQVFFRKLSTAMMKVGVLKRNIWLTTILLPDYAVEYIVVAR